MRLSLITLLVLGIVSWPLSGVAGSVLTQSHDFTLHYGVYGGGFQALSIDITFNYSPTQYQTHMAAKPYGVLGHLLPWAGWYTTRGVIQQGTLIPQLHEKQSAWRDDQSHLRIRYDRQGQLIKQEKDETIHGKTHTEIQKPDPSFYINSTDMLSVILTMLATSTDKNTCSYKATVYDGKRRFEMVFSDKGTEKLQRTKYNIAQGKARKCQLELKPLMGFTGKPRGFYKIQEQGRTLGQLPLIWVAPLWPNGPMAPVKLLIKSDFGAVFVHVQGVKRKLNEN